MKKYDLRVVSEFSSMTLYDYNILDLKCWMEYIFYEESLYTVVL